MDSLVFARETPNEGRRRRLRDTSYQLYSSGSLNAQQTDSATKNLRIWDVASRASLTPFKRLDNLYMTTTEHDFGDDFPALALFNEVRESNAKLDNPVSVLVSLGLGHDMSQVR